MKKITVTLILMVFGFGALFVCPCAMAAPRTGLLAVHNCCDQTTDCRKACESLGARTLAPEKISPASLIPISPLVETNFFSVDSLDVHVPAASVLDSSPKLPRPDLLILFSTLLI